MLKKLLPVYWVIFLAYFGYSLMITVFTPMMLESNFIHGDISHRTIILGLLLMLYPLGQFLGSPVLGAFSDRFGRKHLLLFSLVLSVIFYALVSWSLEIHQLGLLMVFSFLLGLSEGNIAISQGAIVDLVQPEERGRYFGYIFLAVSAGYVAGPLLGGKLTDTHLASWFTFSTPFWFSTILVACAFVVCALFFKESHPPHHRVQIHYFQALTNISKIFTQKNLRRYFLINFCFYMAVFGFFRSYPMYIVHAFHLDVSHESEYIAWVSVPIITANLYLTGKLFQYLTAKQLAVISGVFLGIMMMVIIAPSVEWALWITLFLAGLGAALVLPSAATLISQAAPADEQGRVMGNNQSLCVGAEAISAVTGGLLAAITIALPLVVFGCFALIGVLILLWVTRAGTSQCLNL